MIVIVMTYYNRPIQLAKTLESFSQYDPKEFSVVIVDDCSDEEIVLKDYPFAVTVIRMHDKTWTNPEPAYNVGIKYAITDADIIILQNAECYHLHDMLTAAKTVTDDSYITFGCYSQGKDEEPGSVINNKCASFDGESAWYNHPVYRPVGYDFCSAITPANMIKLNGYDERFSDGIGYGDNYLLARIIKLGLKVLITDLPFVVHQWHYSSNSNPDAYALSEKNRLLYNDLIKSNNYKAKHLITEDL